MSTSIKEIEDAVETACDYFEDMYIIASAMIAEDYGLTIQEAKDKLKTGMMINKQREKDTGIKRVLPHEIKRG